MLLLFPGTCVQAEERVVKFQSGAETGKVTLRIWDLQTLEGTVKVKAVDGGEVHLESVSVTTNDPANTEVCEAYGNKVYMVSNGALIKTTITVDLSFVEDGEYLVILSGGCTNKKGKYSATGLYEEQSVLVGAANVEEEAETPKAAEEEIPTKKEAESTKQQTAETKNAQTTSTKTTENEENTTIVRNPQLLEDEDDDETLEKLYEEAQKKETKTKSSFKLKKILWILILILILIILATIGYFLWKRKHDVEEEDYEGAANIDYDIEDDDMMENEEEDAADE